MSNSVSEATNLPAVTQEVTDAVDVVARRPEPIAFGRWDHRKETIVEWFTQHGYPPLHPLTQLFPAPTPAEQLAFKESIDEYGTLNPILVCDGQIADGVARCLALIELGIEWRMVLTEDFTGDSVALRDLIIDRYRSRRMPEKSQRAMVAARFANMRQGARKRQGAPNDLSQNCEMSQREAAVKFRVCKRLVEDAVKLRKKGTQELCDAVFNGDLAVSSAIKAIKLDPEQQRRILKTASQSAKPDKAFAAEVRAARNEMRHQRVVVTAQPDSRYPIVLPDNPWEGHISYTAEQYPRKSIEELCSLKIDGRPIRDLAAPNAILFLWILDRHVFDPERPVERILEAWGAFQLHLPFLVWPKPHFSVGTRCRGQHELVVMATRGNFPPPQECRRFSSLIVDRERIPGGFRFAQPHDERHSSKPDRLQEMIEEAYPEYFGPETVESPLALELFSRRYRPKWEGWGNDYPGRPPYGVALESWTPQTPAS
jgi:N6-adenosine-specific RNA methylase IME4/ParB-like chromosome segregation protein Spo0J